ncbi:MAG: SMI1/KNR4 family protein [Rubinisphaera brasiliensis]|uniref:SMI1/KNR4 family protein n=1 Tax=Rubinisphaera brasiliensis TaxID=119 RepID=UPI00391A26CE
MELDPTTVLPPPTTESIQSFEKAYRITLPSDFVEFLRNGNGGVPVEKVFVANHRKRVLESFLSILETPENDLMNGWCDIGVVISQLDERLIDDENLIGMNVIPIAVLFGGDFICLDFRHSQDAPAIAVWDHEQSDEFSPHLEVVADSFTEFTSQLRS